MLVDGANGIIAGHGRVLAARKLGLAHGAGDRARASDARRRSGPTSSPTTSWPSRPAGTGSCWRWRSATWRTLGFDLGALGFDAGELDALLRRRRGRSARGRDARAARRAGLAAGRSLAASGAHRLLCGDATDAADGGAAARRRAAAPDGHRSALRRELRPGLAQPGRGLRDHAHRQGAERRPGRLARGLGAVPRRRRLCLARRAARHHGGREPRSPAASPSARRSSGPRSGWCSAAATTTGSTSPAGTRCGTRARATGPAIASRRRSGRSPAATRTPTTVHGTQKPVECMRRPILNNSSPGQAVYEPFSRIGHHDHRRRDDRPRLPRHRARPGLCRCRRAALAGLHRARRRRWTATAAASPRSPRSQGRLTWRGMPTRTEPDSGSGACTVLGQGRTAGSAANGCRAYGTSSEQSPRCAVASPRPPRSSAPTATRQAGYNHAEPVPPTACRTARRIWRSGAGEWHRLAGTLYDMGVLTMVDRAALAAYCQAYGRWVEAEEKLSDTPALLKTPSGYVQQIALALDRQQAAGADGPLHGRARDDAGLALPDCRPPTEAARPSHDRRMIIGVPRPTPIKTDDP